MACLTSVLDSLLREAIFRHSLDDHSAAICSRARATILLQVSAAKDNAQVPIGVSRFGGTPDLPAGVAWPRNPEDNLLLDFIGQINLSQLPDIGRTLPREGLLSLFAQQESASDNPHAIHFSTAIDSLATAGTPNSEDFSDECTDEPFGILLVKGFIPSVSLPDSLAAFPEFDDQTHDAYSKLMAELHDDRTQKEPTSRIFGYPNSPHGSALNDDTWELVAQVESHFANGRSYLNFWDAGCLQFVAPRPELSSCNFRESVASVVSM
ncbi:MAG: YwqG family protein [Planctomycetota bacterium]